MSSIDATEPKGKTPHRDSCPCGHVIKWDARRKKQGFAICFECGRVHDWVNHLSEPDELSRKRACKHEHRTDCDGYSLGNGVYIFGSIRVKWKCLSCQAYFDENYQWLDDGHVCRARHND